MKTILAIVVVIAGFLAYMTYAERHAERLAVQFCATLSVGEDVSGLRDRAIASGADERRTIWFPDEKGVQSLPVMYTGLTPIDRRICWIQARAGRIVSFKYVYLD